VQNLAMFSTALDSEPLPFKNGLRDYKPTSSCYSSMTAL